MFNESYWPNDTDLNFKVDCSMKNSKNIIFRCTTYNTILYDILYILFYIDLQKHATRCSK